MPVYAIPMATERVNTHETSRRDITPEEEGLQGEVTHRAETREVSSLEEVEEIIKTNLRNMSTAEMQLNGQDHMEDWLGLMNVRRGDRQVEEACTLGEIVNILEQAGDVHSEQANQMSSSHQKAGKMKYSTDNLPTVTKKTIPYSNSAMEMKYSHITSRTAGNKATSGSSNDILEDITSIIDADDENQNYQSEENQLPTLVAALKPDFLPVSSAALDSCKSHNIKLTTRRSATDQLLHKSTHSSQTTISSQSPYSQKVKSFHHQATAHQDDSRQSPFSTPSPNISENAESNLAWQMREVASVESQCSPSEATQSSVISAASSKTSLRARGTSEMAIMDDVTTDGESGTYREDSIEMCPVEIEHCCICNSLEELELRNMEESGQMVEHGQRGRPPMQKAKKPAVPQKIEPKTKQPAVLQPPFVTAATGLRCPVSHSQRVNSVAQLQASSGVVTYRFPVFVHADPKGAAPVYLQVCPLETHSSSSSQASDAVLASPGGTKRSEVPQERGPATCGSLNQADPPLREEALFSCDQISENMILSPEAQSSLQIDGPPKCKILMGKEREEYLRSQGRSNLQHAAETSVHNRTYFQHTTASRVPQTSMAVPQFTQPSSVSNSSTQHAFVNGGLAQTLPQQPPAASTVYQNNSVNSGGVPDDLPRHNTAQAIAQLGMTYTAVGHQDHHLQQCQIDPRTSYAGHSSKPLAFEDYFHGNFRNQANVQHELQPNMRTVAGTLHNPSPSTQGTFTHCTNTTLQATSQSVYEQRPAPAGRQKLDTDKNLGLPAGRTGASQTSLEYELQQQLYGSYQNNQAMMRLSPPADLDQRSSQMREVRDLYAVPFPCGDNANNFILEKPRSHIRGTSSQTKGPQIPVPIGKTKQRVADWIMGHNNMNPGNDSGVFDSNEQSLLPSFPGNMLDVRQGDGRRESPAADGAREIIGLFGEKMLVIPQQPCPKSKPSKKTGLPNGVSKSHKQKPNRKSASSSSSNPMAPVSTQNSENLDALVKINQQKLPQDFPKGARKDLTLQQRQSHKCPTKDIASVVSDALQQEQINKIAQKQLPMYKQSSVNPAQEQKMEADQVIEQNLLEMKQRSLDKMETGLSSSDSSQLPSDIERLVASKDCEMPSAPNSGDLRFGGAAQAIPDTSEVTGSKQLVAFDKGSKQRSINFSDYLLPSDVESLEKKKGSSAISSLDRYLGETPCSVTRNMDSASDNHRNQNTEANPLKAVHQHHLEEHVGTGFDAHSQQHRQPPSKSTNKASKRRSVDYYDGKLPAGQGVNSEMLHSASGNRKISSSSSTQNTREPPSTSTKGRISQKDNQAGFIRQTDAGNTLNGNSFSQTMTSSKNQSTLASVLHHMERTSHRNLTPSTFQNFMHSPTARNRSGLNSPQAPCSSAPKQMSPNGQMNCHMPLNNSPQPLHFEAEMNCSDRVNHGLAGMPIMNPGTSPHGFHQMPSQYTNVQIQPQMRSSLLATVSSQRPSSSSSSSASSVANSTQFKKRLSLTQPHTAQATTQPTVASKMPQQSFDCSMSNSDVSMQDFNNVPGISAPSNTVIPDLMMLANQQQVGNSTTNPAELADLPDADVMSYLLDMENPSPEQMAAFIQQQKDIEQLLEPQRHQYQQQERHTQQQLFNSHVQTQLHHTPLLGHVTSPLIPQSTSNLQTQTQLDYAQNNQPFTQDQISCLLNSKMSQERIRFLCEQNRNMLAQSQMNVNSVTSHPPNTYNYPMNNQGLSHAGQQLGSAQDNLPLYHVGLHQTNLAPQLTNGTGGSFYNHSETQPMASVSIDSLMNYKFPSLEFDPSDSLGLTPRGSSAAIDSGKQKSSQPGKDQKNCGKTKLPEKSNTSDTDATSYLDAKKEGDSDVSGLTGEEASMGSDRDLLSFQPDSDGETSLHLLCNMPRGEREKLSSIPGFSTALNLQNNNGETALFVAVKDGNVEVVHYLLRHGADVNVICLSPAKDIRTEKVQQTALHEAVETGNLKIVQALLASSKTNVDSTRPASGLTPLMLALQVHSRASRKDIIMELIEHQASLTVEDNLQGKTPFMYAIQSRDVSMVEHILRTVGAEEARDLVTCTTKKGMTCLHFAAELRLESTQKQKLLRHIIIAGGDPSMKNSEGETARDWAKKDVTEVLQNLKI